MEGGRYDICTRHELEAEVQLLANPRFICMPLARKLSFQWMELRGRLGGCVMKRSGCRWVKVSIKE